MWQASVTLFIIEFAPFIVSVSKSAILVTKVVFKLAKNYKVGVFVTFFKKMQISQNAGWLS